MGVTMHSYVEYKNNDGEWTKAIQLRICEACEEDKFCFECGGERFVNVFDLFLGDSIRQVLGGCGRYEGVKKIKPMEDREWPKDTSCKAEVQWLETHGYYGFSYHTLTDLEKYNWDEAIMVSEEGITESYFYTLIMPAMREFARDHCGSDNIRILFYFDC